MEIISTFNGMGCIWLALNELGIKVTKRYSSEIDKYANIVNNANYPDTIQLGDVTKWREWDIDWSKINLFVGGSPCQGFSFAGKQLNFDDPRSKLFFVFVDILNHIKQANPDVIFLLENVKMKKEYRDIISGRLGVEPIEINSSLVSAQNRKRLYWTNIPGIAQPKDRKILLKDILEDGSNQIGASRGRYIVEGKRADHKVDSMAGKTQQRIELRKDNKSNTLTTVQKDNYVIKKVFNVNPSGNGMNGWVYDPNGKCPTLTTNKGEGIKILEQVEDKLRVKEATKKGYAEAGEGEGLDLTFPTSKTRRGRLMKEKSNCLTAASYNYGVVEKSKIRDKSKCVRSSGRLSYDRHEWDSVDELHWRKLTPLECERLQTVPDNYTLILDDNGKQLVSNTQRYKMLGNGWTVDVIAHILSFIATGKKQLDIFGNEQL